MASLALAYPEVAQVAATAAYAGFQWTVRLVVYPQLTGAAAADFASYERAHQRRITPLVGVLFASLGLSTGWWLLSRLADPLAWASVALFLGVLSLTGLLAVPLHARLSHGWDADAQRSLLRVDGVRVALATTDLVIAVLHATR